VICFSERKLKYFDARADRHRNLNNEVEVHIIRHGPVTLSPHCPPLVKRPTYLLCKWGKLGLAALMLASTSAVSQTVSGWVLGIGTE
jgi:hypothetical protein